MSTSATGPPTSAALSGMGRDAKSRSTTTSTTTTDSAVVKTAADLLERAEAVPAVVEELLVADHGVQHDRRSHRHGRGGQRRGGEVEVVAGDDRRNQTQRPRPASTSHGPRARALRARPCERLFGAAKFMSPLQGEIPKPSEFLCGKPSSEALCAVSSVEPRCATGS